MTETSSPTQPQSTDVAEAAPNTLRGRLRERREAVVQRLYTDRDVPRLPGVVVRFGPIPGAVIEQINKRTEKSKDPERFVLGAASSLTHACLGIYDVTDDEDAAIATTKDGRHLVSIDAEHPHDEPPRFDARLAKLLGLPDSATAVQVVRGFYLTDGDIVSESNDVTVWSGYAGEEADEDYSGN
jgi:hypothetical protein